MATDAEKITRLEREIEELKAENERLRRALEEALRSAKRQAAPFSRRHPKAHPQKPGGVRRFCPRFFEMGTTDRRTFWAYFFQALAGAEAGLNPNTSIRHSEPESAMATRSEGLLQLAYADHKRYGCDFNWQVDRALKANDPAKTILPAEEQSRMWSEDPSQPDHYPAQTLAESVRVLVDVAAGRTELPCIRQANDKSPCCMWFVHQVGDREIGYDKVRAERREPG